MRATTPRARLAGGLAEAGWAAAAAVLRAVAKLPTFAAQALTDAARRCDSRAAAAAKGTRRPS